MHAQNLFTFGPITEVSFLFAGILATMMPALGYIDQHGQEFGVKKPSHRVGLCRARDALTKIRIGILTGGGDCPGLNDVVREVGIAAAKRGWTTLGFLGGFEGLLHPVRTRVLDPDEMDGMLFVGGTIGIPLSEAIGRLSTVPIDGTLSAWDAPWESVSVTSRGVVRQPGRSCGGARWQPPVGFRVGEVCRKLAMPSRRVRIRCLSQS